MYNEINPMTLHAEYLAFIQTVQIFIRQEWEEGNLNISLYPQAIPQTINLEEGKLKTSTTRITDHNSDALKLNQHFAELAQPALASSLLPQKMPLLEKTDPIEDIEDKESKAWELVQLSVPEEKSFEEIRNLLKKTAPRLKWIEQYTPIILLNFEEKEEFISFLENVTKAICQAIAPARLLSIKTLNDLPPCLLILAPLNQLTAMKGAILHTPMKWKNDLFFFPMKECNSYLQDQQLKRALWNSLKALPFPNMPQ